MCCYLNVHFQGQRVKQAAVNTGLVINENKTKYMKRSNNITHLEQDLTTAAVCDGTLMNSKNIISYQIESRITAGD